MDKKIILRINTITSFSVDLSHEKNKCFVVHILYLFLTWHLIFRNLFVRKGKPT